MTTGRSTFAGFGRLGGAAVLAAGLAVGPALAMGGGDSGGNSGGGSSGTNAQSGQRMTCPKGFRFNASQKKCLPDRQSRVNGPLPAIGWGDLDEDFLNAAVLAHAGQYREAIAAFEALGRADDPYVLNYLGYSHRKLGEVETALGYYHRALEIRPDYVRARQYLGEGYLALGRLDAAVGQLDEIARRCGTTCEPYRLLEDEIVAYRRSI